MFHEVVETVRHRLTGSIKSEDVSQIGTCKVRSSLVKYTPLCMCLCMCVRMCMCHYTFVGPVCE